MSGKKSFIIGAIAVAAVAVAIIYLQTANKKGGSDQLQRYTPETARVIEEDKVALAAEEPNEDEVVIALVRMSYVASEEAKPFIAKYLDHSSPRVRAAAIEAAGAFNTAENFEAIQAALDSDAKEVRIAALKALGRNQGQEQRDALNSFLKKSGLSAGEKAWAYQSLFRSSTDAKDRQSAAEKLIKVLGASDSADAHAAALSALPMLPGLPSIVAQAEEWMLSAADGELAAKSVQFLSTHSPDSIDKNFPKIKARASLAFKNVMEDYVRRECPAQSQALAERLTAAQNGETKAFDFDCDKTVESAE